MAATHGLGRYRVLAGGGEVGRLAAPFRAFYTILSAYPETHTLGRYLP